MLTWRIFLAPAGILILCACLATPASPTRASPEHTLSPAPVTALPTLKSTPRPPSPSPEAISTALSVDGAVQALAASPNKKKLAVGSQAGISLVDRTTWKVIWHSTLSRAINSVAFSPDGALLAATSDDGRITIWDVQDSTPVRVLLAASGNAGGAAFSPDGRRFAAGSFKTIQIWDTHTWLIKNTLTGHNNVVWRLVFTKDGRFLASASTDQTILVWDVMHFQGGDQQKPARTLRSPTYWVRSPAYAPDGKMIAAGSGDGVVYVWDAANGKRLLTLKGEQGFIWDVTFSPTGDRLAAAAEDGSIVLWEVKNRRMLRKWQMDSALHTLLFDPTNPVIIAGAQNGKILLFPLP